MVLLLVLLLLWSSICTVHYGGRSIIVKRLGIGGCVLLSLECGRGRLIVGKALFDALLVLQHFFNAMRRADDRFAIGGIVSSAKAVAGLGEVRACMHQLLLFHALFQLVEPNGVRDKGHLRAMAHGHERIGVGRGGAFELQRLGVGEQLGQGRGRRANGPRLVDAAALQSHEPGR